jgi:hypothetical protein
VRVALTSLALAACVVAACGPSSTGAPDAGAADGEACTGDAPGVDAALEVGPPPGAPRFCGGAIALAGVTPFGVFAPNAIASEVAPAPSAKLQITLAEDPPSGIQLTFDVPGDPATGSFEGVHDVPGFLEKDGVVMPVMIHADVKLATDALGPDGGVPTGEARLDVTITTDCGSFSGSLVARYCGAAV